MKQLRQDLGISVHSNPDSSYHKIEVCGWLWLVVVVVVVVVVGSEWDFILYINFSKKNNKITK